MSDKHQDRLKQKVTPQQQQYLKAAYDLFRQMSIIPRFTELRTKLPGDVPQFVIRSEDIEYEACITEDNIFAVLWQELERCDIYQLTENEKLTIIRHQDQTVTIDFEGMNQGDKLNPPCVIHLKSDVSVVIFDSTKTVLKFYLSEWTEGIYSEWLKPLA